MSDHDSYGLPSSPALFTPSQWKKFFEIKDLDRCLHVGAGSSDLRGLRAPFAAFSVKPEALTSDIWLEDQRAIRQQYSTYSKTLSTYFEAGYDSESVSVGIPGIFSESVNHKESHRSSGSTSHESFYSTCRLMVPTGTVNLRIEDLEPTEDFVKDMHEAVSIERSVDRAAAVVAQLRKYGHYIVTRSALGGVLYATQSFTVDSSFNAESSSESVSMDFSANLEAMDVPVSIGGGAGAGTSSGSSSGHGHKTTALHMQCNGGNPGFLSDYAKWAGSLDGANYMHWAFIGAAPGQDVLYPVINILPVKILMKAAEALSSLSKGGESDAYVRKGMQALMDHGSF